MPSDWQSGAALTVVFLTVAIMVYRLFAKKKAGCNSDCGCAGAALKKKASRSIPTRH
ncbi:MAG: FeoB-associated Cys-rich membrane protein [Verrucomicrobia bacterium]|nr:FeoB-associated Cys-rich membrane protein [Verrucomicrobiota bacterium]